MKLKNKYLPILIIISLLILMACADDDERKIKLADRPVTALMQDKVETIELAAAQKTKVALLNFQNNTRHAEVDWLIGGINQKLSRELARSSQLNLNPSLFVQDVFDSLNLSLQDMDSERNSSKLAQKVNADVLIRGDYSFDQDVLHVNLELRDADGRVIRQFSRQSQQSDTLAALNSIVGLMALDIRHELEDPAKGGEELDGLRGTASTTSIEALKLFIKGRQKIDQFYWPDALPLFQKAVQLDTTFASAYHYLGQTLMEMGMSEQARRMFEKAIKYSTDLSDRERIPIEASRAILDGEYYRAIELYTDYIKLYPEDADAHYQIGQYYFSMAHDYHKAIEKYETTVELNPKHKMAHNQLAYAYAYIGELEHAFDILKKYAEIAPNEPNPFDSYAEILQREGRLKEAIKMYNKALDVNPDFWHSRVHLAVAYQDMGKTRKAERLLEKVLQNSLYKTFYDNTITALALNAIVAGDLDKAEEYMLQAHQHDPDNLSNKIALLYIRPDSKDYQQKFIDEIAQQVELAHKDSLKHGMLLGIVSRALCFELGIDLVDELLDNAIERTTDPILYQAAIAYKLILDFRRGHSAAETQKLYERATDPQTFQYAGPASWDEYWRHYFDALRIAGNNGVPVRDWAQGFYQFAHQSTNQHFELNSCIAVAASDFITGHKDAAKRRMNAQGIPCEDGWTIIGPFELTDGFHQRFWPEKISVDKWPSYARFQQDAFQGRDSLLDGYVNLKEMTNFTHNKAVYALLEVNSKNYQIAQVRFGMSGRLKVWLNGKPVMTKNVRGDAIIDRYIANVKMQLGTNYLLVRVDNAIGELGFYCRMTNLDGNGDSILDFQTPSLLAHVENEQVQ